MKVLLLSRNRVVQELVKLGINPLKTVMLEIAQRPEEIRDGRYDLLLVDDRFEREFRPEDISHLRVDRRILLGGSAEGAADRYDLRLSKPFLPAEIRELFVQSDMTPPATDPGNPELTEVLDREEIRRIRRLLNDEPEATEEGREDSDGAALLSGESYRFEELMALLEESKVKKLKKLLRGARIHISIEFPEEG